jgi:uncharacterized protein YprB with RNaseH-like and TPR domain
MVSPEPAPEIPPALPAALGILVPDLIPYGGEQGRPYPGDLLFFDLDTTGLSGGAGTTAFLAAFGRFVRDPGPPSAVPAFGPARLQVTQYLLLDYPGEGDFLEAALGELGAQTPSGRPPLLVTYNGKSFDSQILKIRCLMNGMEPPRYYHADLLHPSRRLWKRVLPGCSQGEIETAVLGLDRTGDVPGALAPDIWFSFLKTGETGDLLKICDHNVRDITGLAALFAAFARIAGDPVAALETYRVDPENLALRWFYALRGRGPERGNLVLERAPGEQALGEELLTIAADRAYPRAVYLRARELFRRGRPEEGRTRLLALLEGNCPLEIQAAACRALAIDAEWRLDDPLLALDFTEQFLSLGKVPKALEGDMQKRRERLLGKINK